MATTTSPRAFCRDTIDNILDILRAHPDMEGLTIERASATYHDTGFTFKLSVAKTADDGTVLSERRAAFTRYAEVFGVDPEWLDATFTFDGHTYTITGLKTRAHKRPVETKRADGKVFVWPVDDVRRLMATEGVDR